MSHFHERKYKGWSDSNLHKSYCAYCVPVLEEEVPSLYRSQLSPLLRPMQHCMPLKETSSNYCLCGQQCDRKKKALISYDPKTIKRLKCLTCQEPEKLRESLELHLTGSQVEETLAEDRQSALLQHLDLSITALEALALYGQSLHVSQLAACRVLSISHSLTLPQPYSINSQSDPMQLTMQLKQLEAQKESKLVILQDLLEHCSKHIEVPKHFDELMNTHCIRKRDFYTATKNFKNFLSNYTLSVSQMEKLHQQYNIILNDCQESRYILNLELPKTINMRLMALYEGFEKIKKFFNDTGDNNETVILFKSIGEKLSTNNLNSGEVPCDENSLKSELCRKCKVNRADNK